MRTKKRRKLPRRDRVASQVPERPMQRCSLDFVSDQLADCRRFRVLNIVNDHSRFCPGQIVDVSISSARVARYLDDLALLHGMPEEIVLDNSPEGTSRAMFDWSERTGVRLHFIDPGKPVQNAFVESRNGKLRGHVPGGGGAPFLGEARSLLGGRLRNWFSGSSSGLGGLPLPSVSRVSETSTRAS